MKVLIATDGSAHAERAAGFLARLPHPEPLDLTILAVTPLIEFHGSMEVVEWMKRNVEAEKTRAKEACQRIENIFEGADARIETIIAEGHPGEMIVAKSDELGADLIVVGAVGTHLVERLMLGSVSDFVVTHALCSVLVVRLEEQHGPEHHELSICIGDDESAPAEFAIAQLANFGWGKNTKVDLVNVILSPLAYTDIPINIDVEELRTQMLKTLDGRLASMKKLSPNITSHVIENSHVGDGLVKFAIHHESDLMVVGNTGRGLLARFLMGSVSRYVLRHAPCSVWVARERKS